jgi:hypothetical protein
MRIPSLWVIPALVPVMLTAVPAEPPESGWPHVVLENGGLRLEIALPDGDSGYYRSTRFDWSGVICQATWKGVPIFGEFRLPRDPERPDSIAGTAEEFDHSGPSTFAPEGGEFLKIGVGILRHNSGSPYASDTRYELADGGEWKVTRGTDWVEFRHRAGPVRGVAYELRKRIVLGPEAGAFRIERTLVNTGVRELFTEHYGHNFFRIADDPVGRNYQILMPADCPLERLGGTSSPVRVFRGVCRFLRDLDPAEYFQFSVLHQGGGTFCLSNTKAGLEVEVTSSAPAKRFVVFATDRTLSPELFTEIKLPPGESYSWSTRYLVRNLDRKAP